MNRAKRSKTLSEVKPAKNVKHKFAEFSRNKTCAKGSPSFT